MTYYTKIKNTIMNNPRGIMDSTLSYGLQNRIKSNTRLYFYKYNVDDLIEINYRDDIICIIYFPHTNNKMEIIHNDLEFYAGYFKSANLHEKRFLFDLSFKMPVSYEDFVEMDKIPNPNYENFAFVLDRKNGYIYEESAVNIFVASSISPSIDKCILSFFNNSIYVKEPVRLSINGCQSSIMISGLLCGIESKNVYESASDVMISDKFTDTINRVKYNSDFVDNKLSKLKVDKFKRILKNESEIIEGQIVEKEKLKGEVSLRDIIDTGLDKFMKSIKNPKDVLKVIIDTEYQTIRSAYIVKGIMFITPVTLLPINHFRDLLNSDNIEYILN